MTSALPAQDKALQKNVETFVYPVNPSKDQPL
jgi:hypothetical protein